MDFGVDDILVLKATYKGSTRRMTMRKSHDLTVATLEKQLIGLFHISDAVLTKAAADSGVSNGLLSTAAAAAAGSGAPTPTAGTPSAAGGANGGTPGANTPTSKPGLSVFSPLRQGLPSGPLLKLTYKDVEGDSIGMVDDRDLKDALFFQRLNPLRLTVDVPGEGEDSSSDSDSDEDAGEKEKKKKGVKGKVHTRSGSVVVVGKQASMDIDADSNKTLQVYFRAVGVELRETCKATGGALEHTVRKITDMVSTAMANYSSLQLEVRFDNTATINGTGPENQLGVRDTQSFMQQQQQQQQPQQTQPQQPQPQSVAQAQATMPPLTATPTFSIPGLHPSASQNSRTAAEADAALVAESNASMFSAPPAAPAPAPVPVPPNQPPHVRGASVLGPALGPFSCAVCKMSPILGQRYQSLVNPEYELCYACFSVHGLEGNFQKVPASRASPNMPVIAAGYAQGMSAMKYSELGRLSKGPLEEPELGGPPLHEGIECDKCRMCPIMGPRYKSNVRQDYDLCQKCHARDPNPHHYEEILSPMEPSPRH